jgi:predicted amino acid dehydrogenase
MKLNAIQKRAKNAGINIHTADRTPLPFDCSDAYEWYRVFQEHFDRVGVKSGFIEKTYYGYDGGIGGITICSIRPKTNQELEADLLALEEQQKEKEKQKTLQEDKERQEYERLKAKFERQ